MTSIKVSQCVQSIEENEKLLLNEHLAMVFPGMYIIMREHALNFHIKFSYISQIKGSH